MFPDDYHPMLFCMVITTFVPKNNPPPPYCTQPWPLPQFIPPIHCPRNPPRYSNLNTNLQAIPHQSLEAYLVLLPTTPLLSPTPTLLPSTLVT